MACYHRRLYIVVSVQYLLMSSARVRLRTKIFENNFYQLNNLSLVSQLIAVVLLLALLYAASSAHFQLKFGES